MLALSISLVGAFGAPALSHGQQVGHDFISDARVLFRTAACRGKAPLPAVVPKYFMAQQCKFLAANIARYKSVWLSKAQPFFRKHVPSGVGTRVVYPFGGGDLMTALAVFPQAKEVTTLSLEPAGDPRTIHAISRKNFLRYWYRARVFIRSFLIANHSRTVDMIESMNFGKLPGEVIYSLFALAVHDLEPVSLRYFAVQPSGAITYYTSAEFAAADAAVKNARGYRARTNAMQARSELFANMELGFRKAGTSDPTRVHRHVRADLSNKALAKDRRVLAHLEAKGSVPAMTKAASYLLWHAGFSMIRDYLLKHVTWMVSDATGIPPALAKKAGYEQVTYGRFLTHIKQVPNPGNRMIAQFRRLWAGQKYRRLPFRFGYSGGFHYSLWHLMIMRKKP